MDLFVYQMEKLTGYLGRCNKTKFKPTIEFTADTYIAEDKLAIINPDEKTDELVLQAVVFVNLYQHKDKGV